MKRKLLGKKAKYSPELRRFAVTLQFYSAKTYKYVRKSFSKVLPHPRTISRWYQVINGRPGFTQEAFSAIKAKAQNSTVVCNLVIGEMAIHSGIHWNGKKWYGFVDMGTDFNYDNDNIPQANNALVFLAVSLNGYWKVPLGYFLIAGLNGEDRSNLLTKCLVV